MAPVRMVPVAYPSLFQVEKIAVSISRVINIKNVFPPLRYQFLFEQFKTRKFGSYEIRIVPDDDLGAAAIVDRPNKRLYLRASIHSSGRRGDPHPLMVLLHEAVHVLCKHKGIRKKIPGLGTHKLADVDERFDEWLANRVAGAIAMPFDEAIERRCYEEKDLVQVFGVTPDAARQRILQIRQMRRDRIVHKKPPTSKFWEALHDYEKKTGSKLGITHEKTTQGPQLTVQSGFMLWACPKCGRSTGTRDDTLYCCEFCGEKFELKIDLPVSLPSSE